MRAIQVLGQRIAESDPDERHAWLFKRASLHGERGDEAAARSTAAIEALIPEILDGQEGADAEDQKTMVEALLRFLGQKESH